VCKAGYLEFGCDGQSVKIQAEGLQAMASLYAAGKLAQVVN
jgi:hypothetical protein